MGNRVARFFDRAAQFLLKPYSKDFSLAKQKCAWAVTIIAGIFTVGILQAACAFWKALRPVKEKNPKQQSTEDVALKTLKIESSPEQSPLTSHLSTKKYLESRQTFEFEKEGKDFVAWCRPTTNIINIQLSDNYYSDIPSDRQENKIGLQLDDKGKIVSIYVDNKPIEEGHDKKSPWLLQLLNEKIEIAKNTPPPPSPSPVAPRVRRDLAVDTALTSPEITKTPSLQKLQKVLSDVDSSSVVALPGGPFKSREDFLNKNWQTDPAIWAYDPELVPEKMAQKMIKMKKDAAIAIKYLTGDAITNMEGALHSFVNPIGKIHMLGDRVWMGAAGGAFGKNFGNNVARPVVLSAMVLPDFENQEVLYQIACLEKNAKQGAQLPSDFAPAPLEKKWGDLKNDEELRSYDTTLRNHMIYHLKGSDHALPSVNSVKAVSTQEGKQALEKMIMDGGLDIQSLPPYIAIGQHTVSTEVLFNILWRQMKNELNALESSLRKIADICQKAWIRIFLPFAKGFLL
jgi:hypothetical protein